MMTTQSWSRPVIEDPWKSLAKPAAESTISALRVDSEHPWDFFWAKDAEGQCLLVLRRVSHCSNDN